MQIGAHTLESSFAFLSKAKKCISYILTVSLLGIKPEIVLGVYKNINGSIFCL